MLSQNMHLEVTKLLDILLGQFRNKHLLLVWEAIQEISISEAVC